jgi:hypothetical protein
VVNDPEGTAYKYAYFEHPRYALCGKTGSATAHPWPTSYRIPFVDEQGRTSSVIVRDAAKEAAIERFRAEHPEARFNAADVEVASRWPPHPPNDGNHHSHAWFGGFLQPLDDNRRPDWSRTPRIALAILVEFGGSGGRTSGPLAKSVAAELFNTLGPDLDPFASRDAGVQP